MPSLSVMAIGMVMVMVIGMVMVMVGMGMSFIRSIQQSYPDRIDRAKNRSFHIFDSDDRHPLSV